MLGLDEVRELGVIIMKFKMGVGELDSELGGKTKFQEIGSVYQAYNYRMILRESHIEDKYGVELSS